MQDILDPKTAGEIKRAWSTFMDTTGLKPNLLIVGPNGADKVAEAIEIWGMRIVVNDFAHKDYTVGYIL